MDEVCLPPWGAECGGGEREELRWARNQLPREDGNVAASEAKAQTGAPWEGRSGM